VSDTLQWLAEEVEHARVAPPTRDGRAVVVTLRADGGYGPISCQLSQDETASLRAELSVPTGWILETLFYDLSHTIGSTGLKLEGYRAAIHGVRVLRRAIVPHPSGKPSQLYTLNDGELVVPPGGTVPLYACLTIATPDGKNAAVVGTPGPDSRLWKDGSRPFLQYTLVTLSTRIRYHGSGIFAERRWHPDFIRTIEQIGGVETSKDAKEVNRARQDFRLIDDLSKPRPKGGSPKGWRKGRAWTRREILEWSSEAGSTFASDRDPTLAELSAEMDVSPETAGNRVRDAELHWPPTPEELDELKDEE